jgi:hypothetical protein
VSKLLHGVVLLLLAPVGRGLLLLLLTATALGLLPLTAGGVGCRRREYGGVVVVWRGHRLIPGLAIKNPPKKTQKTHLKKPTKNVFFGVF